MIKFEYRPWTPDSDVAELFDPPVVEIVTMTLGDDVSWDEAVCEFKNFLRASGYVIPYDFEDESNTDVAYEDESNTDVAEVERLRAKKKAIHEDLFKDICKAIDEIKEHEKRTDAQHEKRSDPRNA